MIIYLHGFDSNSPGNHEKVLQLQFIDPDVRLISYSTRHPKHDMQHLRSSTLICSLMRTWKARLIARKSMPILPLSV